MKKIIYLLLVMQFFSCLIIAQSNIKIMSYNLEDYPKAPPSNREVYLKTILNSENPDLFMVCELETKAGADEILNISLKTDDNRYKAAHFLYNKSEPYDQLQQLVFYNTKKLILENQDIITTNIRDINHYVFLLNTTTKNTNPIHLDAFVTHLKASNDSASRQKRLLATQEFTSYLSNVPTDHYVVFGGDFNFYSYAHELGIQEILKSTNPIVMIDPINMLGKWHDNPHYETIHTQATRKYQLNGNGAFGGLDDRFDFIFISNNLQNGTNLHYITNSYKSVGNNGNCLNLSINDISCTGVYSQNLRDTLYVMSDHLPVVLELQTNQNMLAVKKNKLLPPIEFTNGNVLRDKIYFKVNSTFISQSIYIFNKLGQKVKSVYLDRSNIKPIDISALTQGVYYIQIVSAKRIIPLKFVKIK